MQLPLYLSPSTTVPELCLLHTSCWKLNHRLPTPSIPTFKRSPSSRSPLTCRRYSLRRWFLCFRPSLRRVPISRLAGLSRGRPPDPALDLVKFSRTVASVFTADLSRCLPTMGSPPSSRTFNHHDLPCAHHLPSSQEKAQPFLLTVSAVEPDLHVHLLSAADSDDLTLPHPNVFCWAEDRAMFFGDDCVHRFKLKTRSLLVELSTCLIFLPPVVGAALQQIHRTTCSTTDHMLCRRHRSDIAPAFAMAYPCKLLLLREKQRFSLVPPACASPFWMFLGVGYIGSLVFGHLCLKGFSTNFDSSMWSCLFVQWVWCNCLMFAPARPLPIAVYACRAAVLSADLPTLVYLQNCHLSSISAGFWDIHTAHVFVVYVSCV